MKKVILFYLFISTAAHALFGPPAPSPWVGVQINTDNNEFNPAVAAPTGTVIDKCMFAGDSVTADSFTNTVNTYAELLQSKIPSVTFTNVAVSGETALDGVSQITNAASFFTTSTYDMCCIMFAPNDFADGKSVNQFVNDIQTCAQAAEDSGSEKIFIIGYYGYGNVSPQIREAAPLLEKIAFDNGWSFINLEPMRRGSGLWSQWPSNYTLSAGNFHLNTAGHEVVADAVQSAFAESRFPDQQQVVKASAYLDASGEPYTIEITGSWDTEKESWRRATHKTLRNGYDSTGGLNFNATMDADTFSTSNLIFWYEGGVSVADYYDYSAGQRDMDQPTSGFRPQVSNNMTTFDGSDDFIMNGSFGASGAAGWVVEWRGTFVDSGASQQFIVAGPSGIPGIFIEASGLNRLGYRDSGGSIIQSTNTANVYGEPHEVQYIYNGTDQIEIRVDGEHHSFISAVGATLEMDQIGSQDNLGTLTIEGELEYLRIFGTATP